MPEIEQTIRCVCTDEHVSVAEFIKHFFEKHTQGHGVMDFYTCGVCHQTYGNIWLGFAHFLDDHTSHEFMCLGCHLIWFTHISADEHICRCPACCRVVCICQYDEAESREYFERMAAFFDPNQ